MYRAVCSLIRFCNPVRRLSYLLTISPMTIQ